MQRLSPVLSHTFSTKTMLCGGLALAQACIILLLLSERGSRCDHPHTFSHDSTALQSPRLRHNPKNLQLEPLESPQSKPVQQATPRPTTTKRPRPQRKLVGPAYGRVVSGPRLLPQTPPVECPPLVGYNGDHPTHSLESVKHPDGFDASAPKILPKYLAHLADLTPIPHIAHISWKTADIFISKGDYAVHGVQAIGKVNPSWQVVFYNDSETSRYIKDHIPAADWEMIKDNHIVEKVDLFRLLVVYYEGGFYQDSDRLFDVDLGKLIQPNTRMLLPTADNVNFAQDFMFSAPCNEVHRTAIELNLHRRRKFFLNPSSGGVGVHIFVLGPDTYYHGATFALYGVQLSTSPGKETMNRIRGGLNATNGLILTHRELWCDSMVFHNPECKRYVSREQVYGEHGVQHWGQWAKQQAKPTAGK